MYLGAVKVVRIMVQFICAHIKKKWVVKCYRSDKFDCVCSRHFERKDYEKYELLGLPIPTNQIKLLEDDVPSLYFLITRELFWKMKMKVREISRIDL